MSHKKLKIIHYHYIQSIYVNCYCVSWVRWQEEHLACKSNATRITKS